MTSTIALIERLPCPFCGGTELEIFANTIECIKCGAYGPTQEGPECTSNPHVRDSDWNDRAELTALQERLDELQLEIRALKQNLKGKQEAADHWQKRAELAERQRDEAMKALEPFAKAADNLANMHVSDKENAMLVTVGDLRRARAARATFTSEVKATLDHSHHTSDVVDIQRSEKTSTELLERHAAKLKDHERCGEQDLQRGKS